MDGPHYAQTALMWAARSGANKVVKERLSYRPTQAHAHLLSPSHKAQHKRTRRSLAPTSTEPQASPPYVRTAFVDMLVALPEMKSALQFSHPSLGAHRCGRTSAPLLPSRWLAAHSLPKRGGLQSGYPHSPPRASTCSACPCTPLYRCSRQIRTGARQSTMPKSKERLKRSRS